MCTFNPQFGQGITHACRHARELRKIFDERYHKLEDISHIFNQRASAISEECWLASTTSDWKTPTLKLIKTDKNGKIQTYQQDNLLSFLMTTLRNYLNSVLSIVSS
ncbi:unnamed protein product [Rotaria sordida]|uniref:Uncharacterized protein n=1 Tax=Rotaria sordida TaxID=392033 RepID=A0A819X1G8_9BILA|nr:unnamed protein product [Rotaria sordida]